MWDFLSQPTYQAMLSVAGLLIVVFVSYHVIVALRPTTSKDDTSACDLASDFEEMRLEGDINEQELRSIRAVLGKTQEERQSGSSESKST